MPKQKSARNLVRAYILPVLLALCVVLTGVVWSAVRPAGQVAAATNGTVNFQARLQTAAGSLVPDGFYNVEFKLYDVATGGSALWTETRTGGNTVRVTNGYLTVNLGSVTPFDGSINWDQELWLTMNVGGTGSPTWDGEMDPRLKLTAVPYAFRAGQLALQTGANTSTLSWATQNAANSILLPDASGTICLQSSANCDFAPGTAGDYIQNQNIAQQATSNFWISGTGRADTQILTPRLNTPSATALVIGDTNTTAIQLHRSTSVTSGNSLTVQGGATNLTGAASGEALVVSNSTSTGSIAVFRDNAADVLTIADGGSVLSRNTANSSNALRVLNASSGELVGVDTEDSILRLLANNTGHLQPFTLNGTSIAQRWGAGTVAVNGYIYAVAGSSDSGCTSTATVQYAAINADGSAGAWSTTTALPAAPVNCDTTATTYNGYIYVETPDGTIYYAKPANNGTIGSWVTASVTGPGGDNNSELLAYNNTLYALSTNSPNASYARINSDGSVGPFTSVNLYGALTNTSGGFAIANGYLYAVGGTSGTGDADRVYYTALNADGSFGVTAETTSMPGLRQFIGATVMNGYLYTIGGEGSGTEDTVFYAPLNSDGSIGSWTEDSTTLPAPRSVYDHIVNINNRLYIVGGWNGSDGTNTVYYAGGSRVTIGGGLDLVGLSGESLAQGGSGGQLTAGNTHIAGTLDVTGNAKFKGGAVVNDSFAANGSVTFQNVTDSTAAFKVINAAGTGTVLSVDTSNQRVGIGTSAAERALDLQVDSATTNAPPLRILQNGTGDTSFELQDTNGKSYFIGMDASDGGAFKIASSTSAATTFDVGTTAMGGLTTGGGWGGYVFAQQVTVGGTGGVASSISIYMESVDSISPGMKAALYADNSGAPGALVSGTDTSTTVATGWNTIPISGSVSASTTYWLAINFEGDGSDIRWDYTGGAGPNSAYWVKNFGTNWVSSPTLDNTDNSSDYSIYMSIVPGGSVDSFAGTNLLKLSDTGAFALQNSLNSANAFSVQNVSGSSVLRVDTSNGLLQIGQANALTGAIRLFDASGANSVTLQSGDTASSYSLTLPTALGGSGDCLKQQDGSGQLTFAACGAESGTLQGVYNASTGGVTPEIKVDSTRGAVDIQDADTPVGAPLLAVRTSNASGLGNTILSVNASGAVLGQASALNGSLTFNNATDSNTVTVQSGATGSSYALTLPTALGGAGYCLIDTDGNGILGFSDCDDDENVFVQGGNAFGATATLGTTDNNALTFLTNNSTVLSLSGVNGAATFQNSADSSSALRVSNASGNSVLTVDTSTGQVLLGAPNTVSGALVFSSAGGGNTTTLQTATPSANQSITLPNASGTVCLTSGNCAGVGGTGDILQGGNTLGTDIILGSNDNNDLLLETNDQTRVTIDTSGSVGIGAASSGHRLSVASAVSGSLTDAINDDFDPSIDGAEWSSVSNGTASTACGGGSAVSGNALRFTGSGTRSAATIDMNSAAGGIISFYLFTSSSGGGSCESTEAGEDILLEYSNSGGDNWTTIAVYDEGDFHTIDQVTLAIPAGAQTSSTRFRWSQVAHNGSDFDNWTLDNVVVSVSSEEPATIYGYNNSSYGLIDLLRLSSDVGGTNDAKFRVLANGDVYADGTFYGAGGVTTGSADLAEVYRNNDNAQAGDVVVFTDSRTVEKSSAAYQTGLAGVVSTQPGFTLNVNENGVPVALSGRVPVKVSAANGAIQKGDYLTSGPDGRAQKATAAGPTIGTALEDAAEDGTIEVFVHLGYYDPVDEALFQSNVLLTLQSSDVAVGNLNVSGEITAASLHVSGDAYIGGELTVGTAKVTSTLTVGGRIISQGQAVEPQVLAAMGYAAQELSSPPNLPVTADGTDTAGTVTFTTGDSPETGQLLRIEFSTQYEADPRIVLEPNNADSANLKTFINKDKNGFTINAADPPHANKNYSFDYIIIGSETE